MLRRKQVTQPNQNGSTIVISDDESENDSLNDTENSSTSQVWDHSADLFDPTVSLNSEFTEDSSLTCHEVRRTKLKTFKTYGKAKWNKRRELSDEWENAKKTFPTAPVSNKWNVCIRDKTCQDEKPKKETSNTLKTPRRVSTNEEKIAKHSTPCSDEVFHVSPCEILCTPVFEHSTRKRDAIRFHRSITFSNSPTPKSSSSVLKNVKSVAISSLLRDKENCSNVELLVESGTLTEEEQLLALCEQKSVWNFAEYVEDTEHPFVYKIGEGSYGEVYLRQCNDDVVIVKVVPVGCEDVLVRGVQQMSYEEIITEMSICKILSGLSHSTDLHVDHNGFVLLRQIVCCKGVYPSRLVQLWDDWDSERTSENENPASLQKNQKYVLLETDYAGDDLESYIVKNEMEALSILKQVVMTLALAELSLQFEHRDLHWGNILIKETDREMHNYHVADVNYSVDSCGLQVTIIDFTLSRIQSEDCVIFTDLSTESDLFTGKEDLQFNVYREIREHNGNEWESFNPYTNVLWIHYLAQKLIEKIASRRSVLNIFMRSVLTCKSAYDILESSNLW